MNEYLMLFRNETRENSEPPTPEQIQTSVKQWQSWIGSIAAQGKYSGTNRLMTEGKTIKSDKVITDGPFIEAKEVVGGYLIVKANTIDEAVEMAKSCPGLHYGGSVEVRGVMAIEYDSNSKNFLQPVNES